MNEVYYPIDVILTCDKCGLELYWVGGGSKIGIQLSVAPCRCVVTPESTEPLEEGKGE